MSIKTHTGLKVDQEIHNMNDIKHILEKHDKKALSANGIRIDMVARSLQHNLKVYYKEEFEMSLLGRSRQGWTREGVLEMMNSLLSHFGLKGINDITVFNKDVFSKDLINEIKEHIPPVIIHLLPDGTYKLEDGNHRVGLAEQFLKLEVIRAFIIE